MYPSSTTEGTVSSDALLESVRRLCRNICQRAEGNRLHHVTATDGLLDMAECLAENVQKLDSSLSQGGPLPGAWTKHPKK